jgi:hypothetical protein
MNLKMLAVILLASPPLWACSPGTSSREAAAAERPPPVLEGAWRRIRVDVETGPNAGAHDVDTQPGIYIFSKTHYAITAVDGFAARPYVSENPTDEESGRAFAPFTGSTGAYASDTDKLTLTPQVTKNPADMVGGKTVDYDLTWVDDTVWLTETTPEGGSVRTQLARLSDDRLKVSPAAARLKGVWRRAEMIVGAGEEKGRHVDDMQPGYYIFSPPTFAGNFVSAFAPRPLLGEAPTDADLGKAFTPFASFAGTYTVDDKDVLVLHPLVTMNPNNMRGRPYQSIKTEWAGEDVWFIYTGVDGIQNRVRLTRVPD